MWQGEEETYELIDKETAEEFLLEKAGNAGWDSLTEDEIQKAEEYGFSLLEETA